MRILIVSQYFWPENFRINDLAEELSRRGHAVTVLTGRPNYPEGRVFADYRANPQDYARLGDVPVIRVPMLARGSSSIRLMLNYLSFAVSATLLGIWKLRGQRFDGIFVFQISPITAALPAIALRRVKRAPMLMWVLDLWPDTLAAIGVVRSPRLLSLVGRLVRFVYDHCDRILVQSRAFTDKVAALAGGAERIRYFPGWAESLFDGETPAERAPELAAYDDDFKILFAGNIGEAQDFPAIIAAADALRDTPGLRWLIVGDGRAAVQVREEIARRGLQDKIVLLGRFPLERMPSFFASADALLVTLRKEPIWSLTIPGKVQSYLAAGKPLLAMLDGEGSRVIEEAKAGLVAPAGDGQALAAQVRRLMAMNEGERAAIGRNGIAYGQREFGRPQMVDALENWIVECRSGSPRASSFPAR
ncbi:MAG TPA: glycosyltransferase WbuB [Sphingomonas bacterium]|jgi:glycosyltransferase involved in cell wall biosynthesis|uniref:Glycosyltransferase WbuB n=1 Tax=Sphingomonas bacterium TaxID=1895847 RepID=A0A3D0WBJ4_9SPHN|nr:glycosyltransferase WbuB [Sphingomonas bacterium]